MPVLAVALVVTLLWALLAGGLAGAAWAQPSMGNYFIPSTPTDGTSGGTTTGDSSGGTTTGGTFTQDATTADPSTQDTTTTSGGFPTQDTTTDGSPTADSSGDIYGQQEDPAGLKGMVLGWFMAIMGFVYDSTVGDLLQKVGEGLQAGLLGLPTPSGQVASIYEGMVGATRPVILVGILVTALLMMLRTSNYDVAYAGFSALPKFVGIGMAFAFLPQFMQILSGLTLDVSDAFMPSADRAAVAGADLFGAALANVHSNGGFLNIVFAGAYVWFGAQVVIMAILKNILWNMLYLAGPLALVSSVIPGVSHLAGSWFRGVLACAAIPVLWTLELGIASVIVSNPEVIFGDMTNVLAGWSDGIFTTLGAILMLWLMKKTPFKVLEWAFESYNASGGPWRGIARSVAVGVAGMGIRSGFKALAGGGGTGTRNEPFVKARSGNRTGDSGPSGPGSGARGGGSRTGIGGGKTIRQITGQAARSDTAGALGSGEGSMRSAGRQLSASQTGGGQQGALAGGGQQKALPPASPAIEQKYLKREDTAPGMGRPGLKPRAAQHPQKDRDPK